MAIRNIVKEGDPILNKVCRPVTSFDDRLATETMIAADGVGLAGPQVGMLRRVFVVWDTTDAPEEIPENYEYKFIDFVNPEILAVSEDEETAYEGCLSFPGHNGAVTRPAAVKVRAQDRNGEWFELEAEGLLARCIQHENDHLDGITIMESSEFFYEDTEEGRAAAAPPSFSPAPCGTAARTRTSAPWLLSSSWWWPTAASCPDRCWKRRNTAASTSTSPCCRNTGAAPPCSGRC